MRWQTMTGNDKPDDQTLRELMATITTIAVVGLSNDPSKASHRVATYLKDHGYRIIPVNPGEKEIMGAVSYPDLGSIPFAVDVVDVFRRPEHAPAIADEAVAAGAKVLWLQLGIRSDEAKKKAENAGLIFIQDACMLQEHMRLAAA